jgi:hypothetical protein
LEKRKPNFIRFGKRSAPDMPTFLRFGKSNGPSFLRFGRSADDMFVNGLGFDREMRKPNFLRFG